MCSKSDDAKKKDAVLADINKDQPIQKDDKDRSRWSKRKTSVLSELNESSKKD